MNFIYIESKELLTRIITYLDYKNVDYTTDLSNKADTIVIAQNNKKTLELIKNYRRVIYIAYLDEFKIYSNFLRNSKKSNIYKNKMNEFFNKCSIVITSLPYLKKIISVKKTVVIPIENLCNCICKNKLFSLKKKSIVIIDSNYRYIEKIFELVNKYPEYNYEIIGFNVNLSKKNKLLLNDLVSNVKLEKYCNDRILSNYLNNSNLVIFFDNILESFNYLNICLNLKKNMLLLYSELCNDYFIDNKNIYVFKLDNLDKKFNKIIKNRVCNLGIEGYNLIKDNNFMNISDKFCKILK